MRISDWSSDVCSSDLAPALGEALRIGISQYPTTLHPSSEPSVAKSYVHAMTRRPLTVYDQQWELICMLCTELPSIEAGTAVPADLPPEVEGAGDGRVIALRYTPQPRSEERRVGKSCVSTCRYRWSPYQQNKTSIRHTPR